MSEFEKWFASLNQNGRVTYFLGQEGKISEEAWNARQKEIDQLKVQLSLQRDRNKALEAELTSSRNYGDQIGVEKEKLQIELSQTKQVYRNLVDMELAKVEKLKAEKAGLEKLIKEWRKSANWMCATDDKHVINSLRGCADDLEKALRGKS